MLDLLQTDCRAVWSSSYDRLLTARMAGMICKDCGWGNLSMAAFTRAVDTGPGIALFQEDGLGHERVIGASVAIEYRLPCADWHLLDPPLFELHSRVSPMVDEVEWIRQYVLTRQASMVRTMFNAPVFLVCGNEPDIKACIATHGWRQGEPKFELVEAREKNGLPYRTTDTYFFCP